MNILIVRHAIAEDRMIFAASGKSDEFRPLTDRGRERMRLGASGLKSLAPEIHHLVSSPLVRAMQTADILAEVYPEAERHTAEVLSPGDEPEQVVEQISQYPQEETIALVGHEPDLSELIAWLTCGSRFGYLRFKKGAACLLESVGRPGAASAELVWALTPKQLRRLGRA
jgi:phosphohistidine phosphatase